MVVSQAGATFFFGHLNNFKYPTSDLTIFLAIVYMFNVYFLINCINQYILQSIEYIKA